MVARRFQTNDSSDIVIHMKRFLPPIIYDFLRGIVRKPVSYTPSWNILSFYPLQNFKIFFDPKGKWQSEILSGVYDRYIFDRVEKLDLRGKIVLDVGAFIGYHSFYFSKLVGDGGKIIAFEPVPSNIERMKIILKENNIKNIDIKPLALSDSAGPQTFHVDKNIENGRSSGGFIDAADTIWQRNVFKHRGFIEIKVETHTLDSLNLKPDVIKIDVEGAEYLVLLGGRRTIEKHRPILYIEIHSMLNMFNVISLLSSLSYKTKVLHQEKDGRTFIEALP